MANTIEECRAKLEQLVRDEFYLRYAEYYAITTLQTDRAEVTEDDKAAEKTTERLSSKHFKPAYPYSSDESGGEKSEDRDSGHEDSVDEEEPVQANTLSSLLSKPKADADEELLRKKDAPTLDAETEILVGVVGKHKRQTDQRGGPPILRHPLIRPHHESSRLRNSMFA